MTEQQRLQQYIDGARRIVFFGGAGVSTESGVPDFRSQDGLYRQTWRWPPETILSHTFFREHPEEFFAFYRQKLLPLSARPNPAHLALARLEQAGKLSAVITQNIDGLHQAAGSKQVLELHGSIHRNYCVRCHRAYSAERILHSQGIPRCSCGGIIKPDVVLYEESLDETVLRRALDALAQADLLIIGGTSLAVYPAAGLISAYRGGPIVLINREATPRDGQAALVLREPIGQVLGSVRIP